MDAYHDPRKQNGRKVTKNILKKFSKLIAFKNKQINRLRVLLMMVVTIKLSQSYDSHHRYQIMKSSSLDSISLRVASALHFRYRRH